MKEIRLTTEDVRADLLDYFRDEMKEFAGRAKHLKRVVHHIRNLPTDSLDLRRLATCPDLYSSDEGRQLSFPPPGHEDQATLSIHYNYWCYWMVHAGYYCSTKKDCIVWFEEWMDHLIEDSQIANSNCDDEDDELDDDELQKQLEREFYAAAWEVKEMEAPIAEADDEVAYAKWFGEELRSRVGPEVWRAGQSLVESERKMFDLFRKIYGI